MTWVRESGPVHYVDLLLLSSLVTRLVWPTGRLQGNGPYRDPKPEEQQNKTNDNTNDY